MTQHPTTDLRNTALRLLANGDATMAEAARLIGTSRQWMFVWAREAGIDASVARAVNLTRLWREAALVTRLEREAKYAQKGARTRLPKRKQP